VEAFGPVNTVMPYYNLDEALELAPKGRGSLVGSLFTRDDAVAREVALGVASYHGRLLLINRISAKESTGHGSPLPPLVNGGPGRADGGEELGGIRSDTIHVRLTCKEKTRRATPEGGIPQGVEAWSVDVRNQEDATVAAYTILTLVKRRLAAD